MKRFFILLFTALALFTACDFQQTDEPGSSDRAAGQPTVQLAYATTVTRTLPVDPSTYYTRLAGKAVGYVEVENLAYNKEVIVHYSASGAAWTTVKAVHVASIGNNREIWKFTTAETTFLPRWGGASFDFAIQYKVNGQVYWDNNGGANFAIDCGGVGVSRPQHVLAKSTHFVNAASLVAATATTRTFSGSIVLKNLAYAKNVKVRYSVNNWVSYKEVAATFGSTLTTPVGGATGCESWNFSAGVANTVSTVKYSVSYTVNGVTYWDNNFTKNYSTSF
jgi:hypothetical protein